MFTEDPEEDRDVDWRISWTKTRERLLLETGIWKLRIGQMKSILGTGQNPWRLVESYLITIITTSFVIICCVCYILLDPISIFNSNDLVVLGLLIRLEQLVLIRLFDGIELMNFSLRFLANLPSFVVTASTPRYWRRSEFSLKYWELLTNLSFVKAVSGFEKFSQRIKRWL